MTSDARHRFRRLLGAAAATALVLLGVTTLPALATGSIGTSVGFEDDDGDLAAASLTDWNSFSSAAWTGTAPTRDVGPTTVSGWQILGLEDWSATTSDSGFAGGTKQDDTCPTVIGSKADNKADLKRAYLASKSGSNGHIFLMLAWVRIPQNTTSASSHVAFEFNGGDTPCGAKSSGLVERSAGDMLVVYDFEGGGGAPVIHLSRWITTAGSGPAGTCDITSHTAPCWNTSVTLTATDPLAAEAGVNTASAVSDAFSPEDETLGQSEFGEAGLDLTNAGVFAANSCQSFGTVYAVSRTSGNSGTAQMKDLVGPADFNLSNCTSSTVTTPKLSDGTTSIGVGGVSIGTGSVQVKDSAVVSISGGSLPSASGSVDFWLCKVDSPGLCTTGGTSIGSTTLSGTFPATVTSPAATVTSAGRYCWRAVYSGIEASGIPSSSDSSASECFTVTPVTPTLSTSAGADVLLGNAVTDTATLGGAATQPASPIITTTGAVGAAAGGAITFKLYGPSDTACGALVYTSSGVSVAGNGDYTASYTPTAPGTYHWVASYGGNAPNTLSALHNGDCTDSAETVVVTTTPSSLTSTQRWVPNDSVTVSAAAGGNLAGSVTFTLFTGGTCSGSQVYTTSVGVSGASPVTVSTANTTAVTASGSYSWQVSYDSTNLAQRDIPASCQETSALTIANGGTVTSP